MLQVIYNFLKPPNIKPCNTGDFIAHKNKCFNCWKHAMDVAPKKLENLIIDAESENDAWVIVNTTPSSVIISGAKIHPVNYETGLPTPLFLRVITGFITNVEASFMIEYVLKNHKPVTSSVIDSKNPTLYAIDDNHRKSENFFLRKSESAIVKRIENKAAAISGLPVENIESLQVLHYRDTNDFFNGHHDAFTNGELSHYDGNQRVVSIFVILQPAQECNCQPPIRRTNFNVPIAGTCEIPPCGSTFFPKLKCAFREPTGTAIMWGTLLKDGRIPMQGLHQGVRLCQGEKWAINIWIRKRKF